MSEACLFCGIVTGRETASIVFEDETTVAFMDVRQFHPGHTLIVPRRHIADILELDAATAAAIMAAAIRIARAVDAAFPNQGLTIWHSMGPAANQEVPHFHLHIHPRLLGDRLFRPYPRLPDEPQRSTLDAHAARWRQHL